MIINAPALIIVYPLAAMYVLSLYNVSFKYFTIGGGTNR